MLDKETYLNVLTRYFDSIREDSDESVPNCTGVSCENCMFNNSNDVCPQGYNIYNALEKLEEWSKEHQQKKHKISRIEYMILENEFRNMCQGIANLTHYANRLSFDTNAFAFNNSYLLSDLISYGYYEGANFDTNIKYYLDNCEVVENDGQENI